MFTINRTLAQETLSQGHNISILVETINMYSVCLICPDIAKIFQEIHDIYIFCPNMNSPSRVEKELVLVDIITATFIKFYIFYSCILSRTRKMRHKRNGDFSSNKATHIHDQISVISNEVYVYTHAMSYRLFKKCTSLHITLSRTKHRSFCKTDLPQGEILMLTVFKR